MRFIVINRNPNRPLSMEQVFEQNETVEHEIEPKGMFLHVVVMLESVARVVGRVNVDALDFARIMLFEGFERKEVIAVNEHVIRLYAANAMFGLQE
jgi:hypothetical protein